MPQVLEASNMFGMAPLEELCNAELIIRLHTATACYVLNFARPDSPLKASALEFVASHRHELSSLENGGLDSLSKELLIDLIKIT